MAEIRENRRLKVLLIQPPVYDFALYDHYLKPYGLLRIGRWLFESGWDVDFLNCLDYGDKISSEKMKRPGRKSDGTGKFHRAVVKNPLKGKPIPRRFARYGVLSEVMEKRIMDSVPDLVLITTGMTYWYPGVREAVSLVRKHFPRVPLAAGGTYASLMPDHCMEVCGPDAVLSNQREFIRFLTEKDLSVPGGTENPSPLPSRPLLFPGIWDDAGVIRLNTGCPFRCDYCASHSVNPEFKPGDPREAFEALLEIHRFSGTRNFAFYDDALLFQKEELFHPFLKMVIEHENDFSFYTPNAVHLKYLDEETAGLMVRAGFREIRLGYESSDEDFHRRRDGKFEPRSFPEKINVLRDAGFSPGSIRVYILAGLPCQKASDVEISVKAALETGVSISLAEYSPVPGSPMWEESCRVSRFPLKDEPLYHNNTFFPMEWEGFTREDLERLKRLSRSGTS